MITINILSLIIAISFFIIFLISHYLDRDLNMSQNDYSEHVFGKIGKVVKLSLISAGVTETFFAINLYLIGEIEASVAMFVASLGMYMIGFFDFKQDNSFETKVHSFGMALQFSAFPISLLLIRTPIFFKQTNFWFGLIILIISLIIGLVHTFPNLFKIHKRSILEEINILIMNVWFFVAPLYFLLTLLD